MGLDMDALVDGPQKWHSEYDARCAELRRKQQELMANTGSASGKENTAGIANVAHANIPAFYAWEEGEGNFVKGTPYWQ